MVVHSVNNNPVTIPCPPFVVYVITVQRMKSINHERKTVISYFIFSSISETYVYKLCLILTKFCLVDMFGQRCREECILRHR